MGRNNADFGGEKNPKFRHGLTDGKSYRHPVYTAWQNMKSRCLRPANPKFGRYGGRGITICPEWMECRAFASWAFANGWAEGLTLDRIDNDGHYEPTNCQWISKAKNSRKKSTTKLTYQLSREIYRRAENGENLYRLAEKYNVSHGTVWFIAKEMTWKDLG